MPATFSMVDADWSIDRSTKVISYIGADHEAGTESYATVLQFHRWLQDKADDAVASGDDELDITNTDPSRRSTDNIVTLINGYTLDESSGTPASEHLYDGSIIQDGGNDVWDGIVNFGNSDVKIQIIQNGAILDDDWWNFTDSTGANADSTNGISHRFMIKVKSGGTEIDNQRLIGLCRRWGYTYSEFIINRTSNGNNVLALSDTEDLNNTTASGTLDANAGVITNSNPGYNALDVDGNTNPLEYYYSDWTWNTGTINTFYEYSKWLTVDSSYYGTRTASTTLYGIDAEMFRGITEKFTIASGYTGTITEPGGVSWGSGTTYGSGMVLAVDNTASESAGEMWIQLLQGKNPGTVGVPITSQGGGVVYASAVESQAIAKPFTGQSTGSAIIGAYGLGIDPDKLTNADDLTDLSGTLREPPNNVTFIVGALVSGQDYVLVAPALGTDVNGDPAINKFQMYLASGLTTASENTVYVASGVIPTDTPKTNGTIRITDDTGLDRRVGYSSYTDNIFTLDGTYDFSGGSVTNVGNGYGLYVTYIDKLNDNGPADNSTADGEQSFTSVYSTDRSLVVLVRDGGGAEKDNSPIVQFITGATLSSSGGSATAIRNSDE